MRLKRYYTSENLKVGNITEIEGDEFHHMVNVMRFRTNDEVVLFNGDGNLYQSKIVELNKKNAKLLIETKEKSKNEPAVKLTIFQALAKGEKLSLIMQKITEIGASELVLFESKFCDVKSNTSKAERLENITISAAKQCERATLVKYDSLISLKQAISSIKSFDKFYVTYENEDHKELASELIKNKEKIKNIAIMIGPEGGFATEEIESLKENGAEIVSLGKRILRTETAAILSASLVMQILENT